MAQTSRPLTLAALLLSMSMAALEATVAATAMPTIIADLGGIHLYGWVTAAYLLASTVTVPLFGKLSDLRGRKPILMLGLFLFVLGSLGSGAARTIVQLVAMRVVQGVGAGAIQPVALTIVGDIYPLEQRGRVQGYFSALWGVMGIVGPLLGGFLVKVLSWRWAFYINVPSGIGAVVLLWAGLHERVEHKEHSIDWAGALCITLASLGLLLGSDGKRPLLLLFGALMVAAFVAVEKRAKEPVLPLSLLARRLVAVASVTAVLLGAVMISLVTYVPLFVQGVLGGSPTEAGGAIAPMLVGWPIAAATAGRLLTRVGFRAPVILGGLLTCVSSVALAWALGAGVSPWALRGIALVFGMGMGLGNTSLIIALQTSVGWGERGVVTATALFFRTMGSALAVGALGAILARSLEGSASPEIISQVLGEGRKGLSAETVAHVSGALEAGLAIVFRASAAMGVLTLVSALLFPRVIKQAEG